MYVKIHRSEKHFMVAVCDRELIGQHLKNETCGITVNASFYLGEEADEETVMDLLCEATTANIIGKKAIDCAVKCGIVNPNAVIYFGDVPHALYFTL